MMTEKKQLLPLVSLSLPAARLLNLISLLPALLTLSGCCPSDSAGSSGESPEPLRIASRLWNQGEEQAFIRSRILDPYEKKTDVPIELILTREVTPGSLKSMLPSGKGDSDKPQVDIIIAYQADMAEWIDSGLPADLTDPVSGWEGHTFSQQFDPWTTRDGNRYFLPIGADTYLLCAHRNLLPYLPEGAELQDLTWEETAQWTQTVREETGRAPLGLTGVSRKSLTYQMGGIVLAYGGEFPDFSSPAAREAYRLMRELSPGIAPGFRDFASAEGPLLQGEASLTYAHCTEVGRIVQAAPEEFIPAPPPRGPAGRGSVAGTSGIALLKESSRREEALRFIRYLTSPKVQTRIARGTGGFIPTTEEALDRLSSNTPQDRVIAQAVKVISSGRLGFIPSDYEDWTAVKLLHERFFHENILFSMRNLDPSMAQTAEDLKELQ